MNNVNTRDYFSTKTIFISDRTFSIRIMDFENGRFISISEGSMRPRLGSMVVSVTTNLVPATTSIIPARKDEIFLRTIAERTSSLIQGIAVVSTNFTRELDVESAKKLMGEVAEVIRSV